MDPHRFATHSIRDPRIFRILAAALDAVEPGKAVRRYFARSPLTPEAGGKVFALGIGKAALPMLEAVSGLYPLEDSLAVTKHAAPPPARLHGRMSFGEATGTGRVLEGGHPVPDARSLEAGVRTLEFVSRLKEADLLLCLISGGGSSLVTAPRTGITLEDIQGMTSILLASGARIDEVNTLRRRLDRVKGGGLLRVANKARVLSLILSDVTGNPLEAIASGPTAPDPSTHEDVQAILSKYRLDQALPDSVLAALASAPETLKPGDPVFEPVQNVVIADNSLAARAAGDQAEHDGFHAQVLTTGLQGEAREAGRDLARLLKDAVASRARPFCLIAGGETTVTIHGPGRGGRNQELALAAVPVLAGLQNVLLIALATDGEDGPTDAAGAAVTGESAQRAESLGLDAPGLLSRNDSYRFFEGLRDLLKPGPTGTNVNDLIFLFAF